MSGELFDNGMFRVFVPSGWKWFYGTDSDGKLSPKKVHVYKDAQNEWDILSKAGITIRFCGGNEIFLSPKFFYDDVSDIEPFECGGLLWNGFTCTSLGYPYTMLDATYHGITFQVMILQKNGEHTIALEDADVHSVLESIAACE